MYHISTGVVDPGNYCISPRPLRGQMYRMNSKGKVSTIYTGVRGAYPTLNEARAKARELLIQNNEKSRVPRMGRLVGGDGEPQMVYVRPVRNKNRDTRTCWIIKDKSEDGPGFCSYVCTMDYCEGGKVGVRDFSAVSYDFREILPDGSVGDWFINNI